MDVTFSSFMKIAMIYKRFHDDCVSALERKFLTVEWKPGLKFSSNIKTYFALGNNINGMCVSVIVC